MTLEVTVWFDIIILPIIKLLVVKICTLENPQITLKFDDLIKKFQPLRRNISEY